MAGLGLALTMGCNKTGQEDTATPAPAPEEPKPEPEPTEPEAQEGPTELKQLTAAECQAASGTVVGDIGDGAIHRPDYRCANGQRPLGSIRAEQGEPVAVEGAVCCGS